MDFGHAGPSYHCPRTGRQGRGKHWIGTYHFDCGFGLEKSVLEIRAEAAKMEQNQLRLEIAQDMLDCVENDSNFLNTVITGDKSWVYGYDPETKAQSSQWKHSSSLGPKKARQVRSKVKVLLTVFLDSRGVVHHEYALQGQTVTKEYYEGVHFAPS